MRPYNVGSAEALTIRDLAHVVARTFGPDVGIEVEHEAFAGMPAQRYVPAVSRAEAELGLRPVVSLADGIRRTAAWQTSLRELSGASRG
jgi:dTDP-glucose 4,6-dehydratase